jgi:hypothetical protein
LRPVTSNRLDHNGDLDWPVPGAFNRHRAPLRGVRKKNRKQRAKVKKCTE